RITAAGLGRAGGESLIRRAQGGPAANKGVGVCGGIAGDPKGAVLLVGLGVTELSVSIPSLAAVKAKFRQITLTQAQELARQALKCRNAAQVRSLSYP
ncbi:MAG TPA: PTS fructose transporter subunit IIA, partial [Anaerolineae bacterium]|nr:PTS fructose transporter subunit IIA [Anaerolineae bacterium]